MVNTISSFPNEWKFQTSLLVFSEVMNNPKLKSWCSRYVARQVSRQVFEKLTRLNLSNTLQIYFNYVMNHWNSNIQFLPIVPRIVIIAHPFRILRPFLSRLIRFQFLSSFVILPRWIIVSTAFIFNVYAGTFMLTSRAKPSISTVIFRL